MPEGHISGGGPSGLATEEVRCTLCPPPWGWCLGITSWRGRQYSGCVRSDNNGRASPEGRSVSLSKTSCEGAPPAVLTCHGLLGD